MDSDRRSKPTARRLAIGAAVAVVPLLPFMLVGLFGWNWLREPIESRVESATGRAFAIDGDLELRPGWPPRLVAHGVRLGNADWADEPYMAQAERLEARFRPLAVLRGRWKLPSVTLHQPRLLFEWDVDGRFNWDELLGNGNGGGAGADIGRLVVDDGVLDFRDPAGGTRMRVHVQTEDRIDDGPVPMRLSGDGRYRGRTAMIQGRVDSPLLLGREHGYRVDLRARAGDTEAEARGELAADSPLQRFDVELVLAGDDLGELAELLELGLPNSPAYRSAGRLRRDGQRWQYLEMRSTIARSEFAGSLAFDFAGERPRIDGELQARLHDGDPLGPAAGDAADDALLPSGPHGLERLGGMDGELRIAFERAIDDGGLLQGLQATLSLQDGKVRADPLEIELAGGSIDGELDYDASKDPSPYRAHGHLRGLQLPQLFPRAEFARGSSGHIVGSFDLAGHGESIGKMLGSADGELSLLMGEGELTPAPAGEGEGIDVASLFGFDAASGQRMSIRCAYADFVVDDGRMDARALVIDTDETLIVGSGSIDLDAERWQLQFEPRPKDPSFAPLRSPVHLGGPLAAPQIGPDAGRLVLRGGITAGLAAITPPAALLAMIAPGGVEDVDCSGIWEAT
jgi:AsmA family protein